MDNKVTEALRSNSILNLINLFEFSSETKPGLAPSRVDCKQLFDVIFDNTQDRSLIDDKISYFDAFIKLVIVDSNQGVQTYTKLFQLINSLLVSTISNPVSSISLYRKSLIELIDTILLSSVEYKNSCLSSLNTASNIQQLLFVYIEVIYLFFSSLIYNILSRVFSGTSGSDVLNRCGNPTDTSSIRNVLYYLSILLPIAQHLYFIIKDHFYLILTPGLNKNTHFDLHPLKLKHTDFIPTRLSDALFNFSMLDTYTKLYHTTVEIGLQLEQLLCHMSTDSEEIQLVKNSLLYLAMKVQPRLESGCGFIGVEVLRAEPNSMERGKFNRSGENGLNIHLFLDILQYIFCKAMSCVCTQPVHRITLFLTYLSLIKDVCTLPSTESTATSKCAYSAFYYFLFELMLTWYASKQYEASHSALFHRYAYYANSTTQVIQLYSHLLHLQSIHMIFNLPTSYLQTAPMDLNNFPTLTTNDYQGLDNIAKSIQPIVLNKFKLFSYFSPLSKLHKLSLRFVSCHYLNRATTDAVLHMLLSQICDTHSNSVHSPPISPKFIPMDNGACIIQLQNNTAHTNELSTYILAVCMYFLPTYEAKFCKLKQLIYICLCMGYYRPCGAATARAISVLQHLIQLLKLQHTVHSPKLSNPSLLSVDHTLTKWLLTYLVDVAECGNNDVFILNMHIYLQLVPPLLSVLDPTVQEAELVLKVFKVLFNLIFNYNEAALLRALYQTSVGEGSSQMVTLSLFYHKIQFKSNLLIMFDAFYSLCAKPANIELNSLVNQPCRATPKSTMAEFISTKEHALKAYFYETIRPIIVETHLTPLLRKDAALPPLNTAQSYEFYCGQCVISDFIHSYSLLLAWSHHTRGSLLEHSLCILPYLYLTPAYYRIFGPHFAAFNPHFAAFDPHFTAFGPHFTAFNPHFAAFGPHFAAFGLVKCVTGLICCEAGVKGAPLPVRAAVVIALRLQGVEAKGTEVVAEAYGLDSAEYEGSLLHSLVNAGDSKPQPLALDRTYIRHNI